MMRFRSILIEIRPIHARMGTHQVRERILDAMKDSLRVSLNGGGAIAYDLLPVCLKHFSFWVIHRSYQCLIAQSLVYFPL